MTDAQIKNEVLNQKVLPAGIIWLMAISVGVVVANMYYIQPLLGQIAHAFNLTVPQAGGIATAVQVGTALGMLVIVPLGDICERRRLILILLGASALALLLTGWALSLTWLFGASFLVGITSACVHVIVPFAAHLSPPAQRGQVVGKVMSGLLMGILLARAVSGLMGAIWGWRSVYFLAAIAMGILAVFIRLFLPAEPPVTSLKYHQLFKSIVELIRTQPVLRESALMGALFFCTFSAFWTTLVFLLRTPPYHYGSEAAGLFGLVGAAGALGAPWVGRLGDRHGFRAVIGCALSLVIISFFILGWFGFHMAGLIIGVLLMDLGIQAGHVTNQSRIYGLIPEARSRLNTVYMTCYFIGGSLGSYCGAWSWHWAGWWGVCGFSLAIMGVAAIVYLKRV